MSAQDTLFDVAAAMPAETLSLLRDAVERAIAEETVTEDFCCTSGKCLITRRKA
jgi:hypothetical protein